MEDFVIIVQGATTDLRIMKQALKDYKVIYSTWVGEEAKYDSKDVVVFTEKPQYVGPANMNLQKVSTLAGLEKAKELGYKRALKLRSDLIPTNIDLFSKLLDNQDLNFLCWHYHEVYPNCPGYLVDYLMSGKIEDLITLWSIENMDWCSVPEIHITHQYISKLMSNVNITYFLNELNSDNDLYWIKRGIMLSSYQANHIYDKYKKYDFGLNKDFLNNDYIKFLR